MTLQSAPAYISQTGYQHPAELMRNLSKYFTGSASGLFSVNDFVVTPTGTAQQFSIGPGGASIVGVENNSQGAYFAWSEASENLTLTAPSGSPRWDTVLLRVADPQYGVIPGAIGAYWDIISGTPAGSPTVLSDSNFLNGGSFYVPGGWFRLADIRVNPSDTTIPASQIVPNITLVHSPNSIQTKILTGDQSFTSTTTMADVTGFTYNLVANRRYEFDINLGILASSANGVSLQLVGPSGSRLDIGFEGLGFVSGTLANGWRQNKTTSDAFGVFGQGPSNFSKCNIRGTILTAGTAGTFKLQATQGISSGTASWLLYGSSFRLTPYGGLF